MNFHVNNLYENASINIFLALDEKRSSSFKRSWSLARH